MAYIQVSGIDMANLVFNYYLPGVTITGHQRALDQDDSTGYQGGAMPELYDLGQHIYGNKVILKGNDLENAEVYVSSDDNTWIYTYERSGSSTETIFTFPSVNSFRYILVHGFAATINVLSVPAAPQSHLQIRNTEGTQISSIDFGTVPLASGVTTTIQIYNASTNYINNVKIYEVRDKNNYNIDNSLIYYSFKLHDEETWHDYAMTISGILHPSSGIYVDVRLNATENANFGPETSYIRVVGNYLL